MSIICRRSRNYEDGWFSRSKALPITPHILSRVGRLECSNILLEYYIADGMRLAKFILSIIPGTWIAILVGFLEQEILTCTMSHYCTEFASFGFRFCPFILTGCTASASVDGFFLLLPEDG